MMRLLMAVLLALLPGHATAQTPVFFGIAAGEHANPFTARLQRGQFRPSLPSPRPTVEQWQESMSHLISEYPIGRRLVGFAEGGKRVDVMINSAKDPQGQIAYTAFGVRIAPRTIGPVMFTTGSKDSIIPVPTPPRRLNPDEFNRLTRRAETLFAQALPHYMHSGATGQLRVTRFSATHIRGTRDFLVVRGYCLIAWHDGRNDDRCSLFFVMRPTGHVIFGRFGHPEWGPDVPTEFVETITPILFFKIRGHDQILFFGQHDSAWESLKYSIFEFPAIRPVASAAGF